MAKPQTITQKILAAHCGKDYVEPGELIMARVDIALGNDITAPLAIKDFHKVGAKRFLTGTRWCWSATTSPPTKIFLRPSSVSNCGTLPGNRT